MRVVELWRFPVKSMAGEALSTAALGPAGISGDRHWGVADVATGNMLTARRAPDLLFASARCVELGVAVTLPDGSSGADDAALSTWLGSPVRLQEADGERATYETVFDFEHEDESDWFAWQGPSGSFHDSTKALVSIVSTTTMRSWDWRRFRANVIVDGEGEDELVGSTIELGSARLEVVKQIDRCVMVTRPQPGSVGRDLDVLRTINRERAGNLAVGCRVVEGGTVSIGDELRVAP